MVLERVKNAYGVKESVELPEALGSLERYVVINAIDHYWQEHLTEMEDLRKAIGLRSYGQKDPLVEYKSEAYRFFEELMTNVRLQICTGLFRSASNLESFENMLALLSRTAHTEAVGPPARRDSARARRANHHHCITTSGGTSSGAPPSRRSSCPRSRSAATRRRSARNDPCPVRQRFQRNTRTATAPERASAGRIIPDTFPTTPPRRWTPSHAVVSLPTFWDRHAERVAPAVVFVLTVFLAVVSFPPYKIPEAAYAMLVPGIFWAYLRPRFKALRVDDDRRTGRGVDDHPRVAAPRDVGRVVSAGAVCRRVDRRVVSGRVVGDAARDRPADAGAIARVARAGGPLGAHRMDAHVAARRVSVACTLAASQWQRASPSSRSPPTPARMGCRSCWWRRTSASPPMRTDCSVRARPAWAASVQPGISPRDVPAARVPEHSRCRRRSIASC